ncbi:MAG: AraC family transcriptional regulator [Dysgonamonadaceae bacterium]|jgi:AraC-like DNA-binding protein|nr:AraC family transcriptional regulator [Dysgonamonadaceae bacterium]
MVNQKEEKVSDFKEKELWKSYSLAKGFSQKIAKGGGISIVFLIKGSVEISINDGEIHIINSREMFITQDDYSYTIKALRQSQIMTCLFHIETLLSEQAFINELVPLCNKNKETFIKLPVKEMIFSFLSLLQRFMKDNINSYYFFDLKRQELLILLFVYYSKAELAQFLYFIISENIRFKEFIINNYLNVRNVQELAALANYSTSGFIKRFQKCFKDSPYGWMQKQRARQILNDIKQGAKSLQEIAVEYKFSSYQHFSKFCKKQFGFPPTEINSYKKMRVE